MKLDVLEKWHAGFSFRRGLLRGERGRRLGCLLQGTHRRQAVTGPPPACSLPLVAPVARTQLGTAGQAETGFTGPKATFTQQCPEDGAGAEKPETSSISHCRVGSSGLPASALLKRAVPSTWAMHLKYRLASAVLDSPPCTWAGLPGLPLASLEKLPTFPASDGCKEFV